MNILANKRLVGVLVAAVLALSLPVAAQQEDAEPRPGLAPLFASHAPFAVTIEAPMTTLMRDRPEEEYLDGTFSFVGADGTKNTLDLKMRTRGNFRRQEKTCDFTPIRLNFKKKQVVDTVFDNQDKLKLVTHCQSGAPYFEQLLMREYLAYRFLQLLTDVSFSVRLLHITYVDTEGADPMTRYGFVIEDDDDVAARIGMESVKTEDITHADLDPAQENLVNVFQFFIGNTDFSLVKGEPGEGCCHNAELLSATGGTPYTPLPYDFDFAGLVNAPYAEVHPQFRLTSVRQRLYRGICGNNDQLPATIQNFLDNREAMYAAVASLDDLRSRSQRDIAKYLDSFFKDISNPKTIQDRFIDRCNESS
jgi:hypothetical protein